MATLKEIIEYSKANPESDYAKTAYENIVSGDFDSQAEKEGIDLSPFGRPKATSSSLRTGKTFTETLMRPEENTKMASMMGAGVGAGAIKGALETGLNVGTGLQNIGQMVTGQDTGFKTLDTGTPQNIQAKQALKAKTTEEKIGKGIERAAEFMIPAKAISSATKTMGVLPKIASQVASDVGVSIAQEGELNKDVARTALVSSVLSSVPFLTQLLGKTSGVGNLAGKAAKNLEETNLRLTPVGKQSIEKSGQDVIGYLTQKKITGSPEVRYDKVSKIYDSLEDSVQNALKNSKITYTKQQVKDIANALPEQYATEFDNPEVYDQLLVMSKKLSDYADNFKGDIPIEKLNAFKRSYYKNAFNKAGDQVVNEARMAVGDALYSTVLKEVPELKVINKEYSKAILSKKLLGKAIGRNELGLIGNIVSMGAGGAVGTAVGGPIGAGVGAVAGPMVGTKIAGTEARSLVGSKLQTLSEYIKNIKPDQAGNLIIPKSILEGIISESGE